MNLDCELASNPIKSMDIAKNDCKTVFIIFLILISKLQYYINYSISNSNEE